VVVGVAVTKLSEAERTLLKTHVRPPPDAMKGWTYKDQINGQIFGSLLTTCPTLHGAPLCRNHPSSRQAISSTGLLW
jgi:hypothetical protein